MEKAIKLAIEGGWKGDQRAQFVIINHSPVDRFQAQIGDHILLDALFWQALGKAVGEEIREGEIPQNQEWRNRWISFIDHLAEGKDADSFFHSLLKA